VPCQWRGTRTGAKPLNPEIAGNDPEKIVAALGSGNIDADKALPIAKTDCDVRISAVHNPAPSYTNDPLIYKRFSGNFLVTAKKT
jgi:hypothetical protein